VEKDKVTTSAQPWWLDEQAKAASGTKAQPPTAQKAVPWRMPGAEKQRASKPAAKQPRPARRKGVRWDTRILPLAFLVIFALVVGGYLAGWHLG
jgi:hypothetical protein